MGFRKEQVNCRNLNHYPHAVNKVILPPNAVQCYWIDVGVEEDSEPDSQLLDGDTLRTLLVWEHLDLCLYLAYNFLVRITGVIDHDTREKVQVWVYLDVSLPGGYEIV